MIKMRFTAPILDAIFLNKASPWFSHVEFLSVSTPEDLEQ